MHKRLSNFQLDIAENINASFLNQNSTTMSKIKTYKMKMQSINNRKKKTFKF